MSSHLLRLTFGLVLLAGVAAQAQERPSEEEMFGEPKTDSGPPPDATAGDRPGESSLFGGTPAQAEPPKDDLEAGEAALIDPLKIGGMVYMRSYAQLYEGTSARESSLSAPTFIDAYFDARPNDRVRGFVLGRLMYDPTLDLYSGLSAITSTSNSPLASRTNPSVVLDQAWLRFDIGRKVFITAGQQHVRWGTSHLWNPTDFLTPQRRNPLLPFDPRIGASMIKLHVPYEEKGWNFYALALLDNAGPASLLGKVGGAARAEILVGNAEVGADAVLQYGRRPRFGFDLSTPLGAFDIYAEVALKTGSDAPLWRKAETPDPAQGFAGLFESYVPGGLAPAASGGITYTFAWTESLTLTLGTEYFYNSNGYDSPELYPWLILKDAYQPFYLGKHYAALFLMVPAPWDKDRGYFNLSNIANLSDMSFVSRLDFSLRILTHLTIEAYGAVHYGREGGEFRLKLDIPASDIDGQAIPELHVPPPLFELGVGARISI